MKNNWHTKTLSNLFSWLRNGKLNEGSLDSLINFVYDYNPGDLYLYLVKDIVSKGRSAVNSFQRDEAVIRRFFDFSENGALRGIDEIAGQFSEEYSPYINGEGEAFPVMQAHFHRNAAFFAHDLGTRFPKNKDMLLTSLLHYSQVFPVYSKAIQDRMPNHGPEYLMCTLHDYAIAIKDALNMKPSKKQLATINLHYENLIKINNPILSLPDETDRLRGETLESIAETSLTNFERKKEKNLKLVRRAYEFYTLASKAYKDAGLKQLSKTMTLNAKELKPKVDYLEAEKDLPKPARQMLEL